MYHSAGDHVGYAEKKDLVKETTNSRGGSVRRGIMKRFAMYFSSPFFFFFFPLPRGGTHEKH